MNHKNLFMVWLVSLVLLSGCQWMSSLGPSTQVPLSVANKDMSLARLQDQWSEYKVYYSWTRNNPSGILFLPADGQYTFKFLRQGVNRWYEVTSEELLTQVVRRLSDNRYGGDTPPRLRALLSPPSKGTGQRHFLGYIFTNGYASVRRIPGKDNTFAIHPVPEQYNPTFHNQFDGSGGGGGGGM